MKYAVETRVAILVGLGVHRHILGESFSDEITRGDDTNMRICFRSGIVVNPPAVRRMYAALCSCNLCALCT